MKENNNGIEKNIESKLIILIFGKQSRKWAHLMDPTDPNGPPGAHGLQKPPRVEALRRRRGGERPGPSAGRRSNWVMRRRMLAAISAVSNSAGYTPASRPSGCTGDAPPPWVVGPSHTSTPPPPPPPPPSRSQRPKTMEGMAPMNEWDLAGRQSARTTGAGGGVEGGIRGGPAR